MKKVRNFLENALLKVVIWVLPRLPRRMPKAISQGIGTLAFEIDKSGRKTALDNLRCAFGEQYDDVRMHRIAKGLYQTFARTFLDLFWSAKHTKYNWQAFFDIHLSQLQIEFRER